MRSIKGNTNDIKIYTHRGYEYNEINRKCIDMHKSSQTITAII
jgi:hypothetical protein